MGHRNTLERWKSLSVTITYTNPFSVGLRLHVLRCVCGGAESLPAQSLRALLAVMCSDCLSTVE